MMETIEALQKELKLRKELTDEILHGRQKSTEALIEVARYVIFLSFRILKFKAVIMKF